MDYNQVFKQVLDSMSELKKKLEVTIDECLDTDLSIPFYKDVNKEILYSKYATATNLNTNVGKVSLLASKQILYYKNVIKNFSEDKSIPYSILKTYIDRLNKSLDILDTLNKQLSSYKFAISDLLKFYANSTYLFTNSNFNY